MGRMVIAEAARDPRTFSVRAGVETAGHPAAGTTIDGVPIVDGFAKALCFATAGEDGRPVVVDFTRPGPLAELAGIAADSGCAIVSGTTGLTEEAERAIAEAAEKVAVVHAPNMSLGVNLLYRLAAEAAASLGATADVGLVDVHHRHKVDAPSGTAIRIADTIRAARPAGARDVDVQSLRIGEITGVHEVTFALDHEIVTLRHEALDRGVFAQGALAAAVFAAQAPPGRYGMNDVLAFSRKERK